MRLCGAFVVHFVVVTWWFVILYIRSGSDRGGFVVVKWWFVNGKSTGGYCGGSWWFVVVFLQKSPEN